MRRRDIRLDPLTGEAVVVCEGRSVEERFALPDPAPCAFCAGLVDVPVLARVGGAFAVANQVPALRVEEADRVERDGPFEHRPGLGAHEILVESPEHGALHRQAPERGRDALRLARDRLAELRKDRRLKTIGWSRTPVPPRHPLAEVVALPFVPARVAALTERALAWRASRGRPLLAEVVAHELDHGTRLLAAAERTAAFCPHAPRAGFEVWFAPRGGRGRFADLDDPAVDELADLGAAVARALDAALGAVPVAWALVTGPTDAPDDVGWHLRMTPRLAHPGGWEDATGVPMIGVAPETSAAVLRRHLPADALAPSGHG